MTANVDNGQCPIDERRAFWRSGRVRTEDLDPIDDDDFWEREREEREADYADDGELDALLCPCPRCSSDA